MNKQHLYTFGGALLASTALSGAASAMTWQKYDVLTRNFISGGWTIASLLFATTASTANGVVITPSDNKVAAKFANVYSNTSAANVPFSIEMVPTGAEFVSGTAVTANVDFLLVGTNASSVFGTLGANEACTGATGFGTSFVITGCTAGAGTTSANITAGTANESIRFGGIAFSGVTFNNASGLATVGGSVTLSGRVYNSQTQTNFEATSTQTIFTSANPITVSVTAAANVTANASATPTAFTNLSTTNGPNGAGTMDLAHINITAVGVFTNDLTTIANPAAVLSTATVTVQSAVLSSGAVSAVIVSAAASSTHIATVANFSGGSITFRLADADWPAGQTTITVRAAFTGTVAIPAAAAGTTTVLFGGEGAGGQAHATTTGATASVSQGGFRAEVNTFNASTNGPFSSYLRIHNNGNNSGTVNISIRSDDHTSGAILGGSFTTGAIAPGSTMQLSAAEMEGTATSTKLPAGGANIPTASRVGSYTINLSGALVGYVQHILFDGNSVADLSSFRNGANTNSAP